MIKKRFPLPNMGLMMVVRRGNEANWCVAREVYEEIGHPAVER